MRCRILLVLALLCLACAPIRAAYLVRVKMVSPASGWAVGAVPDHYAIYRTTDGGRRWAPVSPPEFKERAASDNEGDIDESSIGGAFLDQRRAWVAVVDGMVPHLFLFVFRTADGGGYWKQSRFAVSHVGNSVFLQFLDSRHGFILGISDPAAGEMAKEVYRTTDGGQTWCRGGSPDHEQISYTFYPTGMTFRTPSEGWVTATYHGDPDAPFLHTHDGGRTWHQQKLPIPSPYRGGYANTVPPQFFGWRRQDGVMLASLVNHTSHRGDVMAQAVFVTHDGGAHWRMGHLLPLTEDTYSDCASFLDAQHWWIVDQQGEGLYATRNSGRSWRRVAATVGPRRIRDTQLDFVTPQIGWALTTEHPDGGWVRSRLYRTRDGGRHWTLIPTHIGRT